VILLGLIPFALSPYVLLVGQSCPDPCHFYEKGPARCSGLLQGTTFHSVTYDCHGVFIFQKKAKEKSIRKVPDSSWQLALRLDYSYFLSMAFQNFFQRFKHPCCYGRFVSQIKMTFLPRAFCESPAAHPLPAVGLRRCKHSALLQSVATKAWPFMLARLVQRGSRQYHQGRVSKNLFSLSD
jgi:hypothetical protein